MRPGAKLYGFHEQPKKVINGPRPSPLMINKDSHMIKKASTEAKLDRPQRINPIIIYTHSPKVIHTKAKDFMALVQRLTGRSSSSTNDDVSTASENFGSSLSDGSNSNNNSNNETSSALRTGAIVQHNSPSHLDFVDMPLFTPNSSDFFCLSRSSVYKYSDSPYGVLGSLISPSAVTDYDTGYDEINLAGQCKDNGTRFSDHCLILRPSN
ncbi:VQ motif-containing protein 8, chloroplastic, partial [Mucuna pruriens]